jgi:peptidoglycan-associated lipoprotein
MKTPTTILTLLVTSLFACGTQVRQTEEPRLTSSNATSEDRPVGWPDLGRGAARFIRIDLGPDSLTECRRLSPKFPFDSAVTYAQDREQLGALATCLNAPGMRERSIQLVGRADPRGSDAYNEELGGRRAQAIRKILIENGIAEARIEIASEGERGAKGDTAEYASGFDRRVDLIVRGGVHVP